MAGSPFQSGLSQAHGSAWKSSTLVSQKSSALGDLPAKFKRVQADIIEHKAHSNRLTGQPAKIRRVLPGHCSVECVSEYYLAMKIPGSVCRHSPGRIEIRFWVQNDSCLDASVGKS